MSKAKIRTIPRELVALTLGFIIVYSIVSAGLLYNAEKPIPKKRSPLMPGPGEGEPQAYPQSILSTDIDGDGLDEIIVGQSVSGNISVFSMTQNRSMGDLSLEAGVVEMLLYDNDGDGRDELIVLCSNAKIYLLRFMLTNGSLTFATVAEAKITPDAYSMAVYTQEGQELLAYVSAAHHRLVMLNLPGLEEDRRIELKKPVYGIATADANEDGLEDIILYNIGGGGGFDILNGTVDQGSSYHLDTGARVTDIFSGRFNQEHGGICVVNYNMGTISFFNITPEGPGFWKNITTGLKPYRGVSGDFNNDGLDEVAVVDFDGHKFTIVDPTNGTSMSFASGRRPIDICSGRFNSDTEVDFAIANKYSRDISVVLSSSATDTGYAGLNVYGPGIDIMLVLYTRIEGTALMLYEDAVSNEIMLLYPRNGTTYGIYQGKGSLRFVMTDLDNDAHPELLIIDSLEYNISVYSWTGPTFEHCYNLSAFKDMRGIAIFDADLDGDSDICTVSRAENGYSVGMIYNVSNAGGVSEWENRSYEIFLPSYHHMSHYDVNRDGYEDVIIYDSKGYVYVMYNRGDGGLVVPEHIVVGE